MAVPVEIIEIRGSELVLSRIIARKYRKYIPRYVERIYDLNPGLAAQGPILRVGTKIRFPPPTDLETKAAIKVLKLW